jgi:hypothetical protein
MKTARTLAILLAGIAAAHATPSGLNNIPTADTTPQGAFVLQGFTTVGDGRDADFNVGLKTGFDLKAVKIELGLSSHLYPGNGGPVTPHAKIAVPLGEGLPVIAAGIANLSFRDQDRRRAGDGKGMRKRGGKPVVNPESEYRDLFTLRADAIQQTNHSWLASFGALIPVCKNFVFEAWGNFPTEGGGASATLKRNFVFKF